MRQSRGAAEQKREVEGWRGSGQSAARYAARRGYSSASLFRWATKARRDAGALSSPESPRFVRVEGAPTRTASLVVEVGRARIVVERGFDAEQLRAVVAALELEPSL